MSADHPFGGHLTLGTGLDGRPLLEDHRTGRSALLSPQAVRLFQLAARQPDLGAAAGAVATTTGCTPAAASAAVQHLHRRLSEAGLVERERHPDHSRRHTAVRLLRTVPVLRVVRLHPSFLSREPDRRRLGPGGVRVALGGLVAVAVVAALVLTRLGPATVAPPDAGHLPTGWLVLALLLLIANAVHEGAHALVCRLLGVAVQEVGVALWWGCLPFWYVEHRGVPRLRSRADHALVALVGPGAHLVMSIAAGSTALLQPGTGVSDVASTSCTLFALSALLNLNPVLPTDGYRALEALTGHVGFRAAAATTVGVALLRLPAVDAAPGRMTRVWHWTYILLCLAWATSVSLAVYDLAAAAFGV